MTRFSRLVDGVRIPYMGALARAASEFAMPVPLNTGKVESQWLGSLLLYLAAQDGEWHAVPWRMLRNEYMRFGRLKRLWLRGRLRIEDLIEDEPTITSGMSGGTPPEELLIGLMTLHERRQIEVRKTFKDDYLLPTNDLLKCAPAVGDTIDRSPISLGPVYDLIRSS